MNLNEQTMPYRRGRILALLRTANQNGLSSSLLRTTLRSFGYKVDDDTFVIDLSWLSRHGLVELRDVVGVTIARLTSRGRDVITGDLDFPGVQLIED